MYYKSKKYPINIKAMLTMTFFMLCWLLFPEVSEAAGATPNTGGTGLAATGTSVGHMGENWAKNIQYVGLAIGIALVVFGIKQLVSSKDGRGSAGGGFAMFIGGAALTSIIALQGTVSETMFGTDQTETIMQTLGH